MIVRLRQDLLRRGLAFEGAVLFDLSKDFVAVFGDDEISKISDGAGDETECGEAFE